MPQPLRNPTARERLCGTIVAVVYGLVFALALPVYLLGHLSDLWPDFLFWLSAADNLRAEFASGARLAAVLLTAFLLAASGILLLLRRPSALRVLRAAMLTAMILPLAGLAVIPYFASGNPAELLSAVNANVWLSPLIFYGCLLVFSNAPAFRNWPEPLPPLPVHAIVGWYYLVWCLLYAVGTLSYIRLMLWPQYLSVGVYLATGTVWTSILMVLLFAHCLSSMLSFYLLATRHPYGVACTQGVLFLQLCSLTLFLGGSLFFPSIESALAVSSRPWPVLALLGLFLLYFLWLPRRAGS